MSQVYRTGGYRGKAYGRWNPLVNASAGDWKVGDFITGFKTITYELWKTGYSCEGNIGVMHHGGPNWPAGASTKDSEDACQDACNHREGCKYFLWRDDKFCDTYLSCAHPKYVFSEQGQQGCTADRSRECKNTYLYRRKLQNGDDFPSIPGLILDLRATDYQGGTTWRARTGPAATLYGSPKYDGVDGSFHFESKSQYAGVPINTDPSQMPFASYSIWMKIPRAVSAGTLGWVMSQYPGTPHASRPPPPDHDPPPNA